MQSITLPESLTSIGDFAFVECYTLQSITLPDSVISIGHRAFSYCRSLQSIVLPDSLTSIGGCTFKGCESLQSIVLPKTLEFIGEAPFTIGTEIVSHSDRFVVGEGLLIDLEEKRLIQCISNEEYIEVPEGIESIGDSAFDGCESLESIFKGNAMLDDDVADKAVEIENDVL